MKREITWKLGNGKQATLAVELITEETAYADGWNVPVKCCKMLVTGIVEGMGCVGSMVREMPKPQTINGTAYTHCIGKLAIPKDKVAEYEAAVAEIESTPEWQAKLARQAVASKADREYEAHRAKMRKVMGY